MATSSNSHAPRGNRDGDNIQLPEPRSHEGAAGMADGFGGVSQLPLLMQRTVDRARELTGSRLCVLFFDATDDLHAVSASRKEDVSGNGWPSQLRQLARTVGEHEERDAVRVLKPDQIAGLLERSARQVRTAGGRERELERVKFLADTELIVAPICHDDQQVGQLVCVAEGPEGFSEVQRGIVCGLLANLGLSLTYFDTRDRHSRRFSQGGGVEQALRESEELFLAVTMNAPAAIHIKDANGRYTFANPVTCQYLGREEGVIGFTDFDLLPRAVAERLRAYDLEVMHVGAAVKQEMVIRREDYERTFLTVKFPLFADEGTVRGVCGVGVDITDLKAAESALLERATLSSFKAELGLAVTRGETLADMLTESAQLLVQRFGATVARIWTLKEGEGILRLQVSAGVQPPQPDEGNQVRLGESHAGRIAASRVPIVIRSLVDDASAPERAWLQEQGMVAFVGHPLILHDRIVGVLGLLFDHDVSDAALEAVALAAHMLAIGIARRSATLEREEAAALLEGSIDALSSQLAILDQNGVIIKVNRAWKVFAETNDYRGLTYGVGDSYLEAFSPEKMSHMVGEQTLRRVRDGIRSVLEGICSSFTMEYPCHSPTEQHWLFMRVTRFGEGSALRLVISHEDVTQQHRAQSATRENEERLRLLADNIAQLAWMARSDGYIFWFNQRWYEYTGATFEDMKGWGWQSALDRNDAGRVMKRFKEAITLGHQWEDTFLLRRHDGAMRWHLSRALPLRDEDGNIVRWLGTNTDITTQREAESATEAALHAAEAANRSKSEFLANMSHEIRTPMTAILGYTEILAKNLQDPDDLQCISTIRSNGAFLLKIINDILDLSRIEAGKPNVEYQEFSLAELLDDIISSLRGRAEAKKLQLGVNYETPVPETLRSDPTRLRQVLVNLVGNAIKFTDQGSVQVVVRLRPGDQLLEFDVTDTGIGIAREQQVRLFEPFVQADASVTRRYGGTGLGLAISRRVIEMLGGTISVSSQHGVGSCFRFTISTGNVAEANMVEPGTSLPPSDDEESDEPEIHCRILVVDDRRDVRYLAQHFLEDAGAEVFTSNNGADAIATIGRLTEAGVPPDVILMDMQMPVMDGYEATRTLRRNGYTGPIIALTANAMHGDEQRCLDAGCDDFASKPIDGTSLVRLVAKYGTYKG